jgi:hypothetical protein
MMQKQVYNNNNSNNNNNGMMQTFVKPERVIFDDVPTLYVYDHCPFCVRVRLALGIKNVKHNLHFLGNDDVKTPTALVGKKIAPIFVSVLVAAVVVVVVVVPEIHSHAVDRRR